MASGLVAKKIALFEPQKRPSEGVCRLKRKHAIRRKRFPRNRRLISEPDLFAAVAEERFNKSLHLFQAPAEVASSLSASRSALLDIIYSSETQEKLCLPFRKSTKFSKPIISIKDKKILCRSSSLDEAYPASLNIIDIDIEIRVEPSQSNSPPPSPSSPKPFDLEPMQPMIVPSCMEKIKLISEIGSRRSRFSGYNSSDNYHCSSTSSTSSNSSNYFCSGYGSSGQHSTEALQEHIYENFSLPPPPRPPKSNSLPKPSPAGSPILPPRGSRNSRRPPQPSFNIIQDLHENKGDIDERSATSRDHLLNQVITQSPETRVITSNENGTPTGTNEEEPFYEDLYDYCLPPDCYPDTDLIQPASVTSFVNDKDEEVEYCDCSTVMAIAISSLNSGGTVIYNCSSGSSDCSSKRGDASPTPTINGDHQAQLKTEGPQERVQEDGVKTRFFYLGDSVNDEGFTEIEEGPLRIGENDVKGIRSSLNNLSACDLEVTNLALLRKSSFVASYGGEMPDRVKLEGGNEESVTVDSNYKKDEDDLDKPLPKPPSYASSASSDSFYSEPIYGITNQITNSISTTNKLAGPPVPDASRRPSLANIPCQPVISCNNVIRNEPIQPSGRKSSTSHISEQNNAPLYADSVASLQAQEAAGGFEPNDKLPPLPPSKLSTIAKTAKKKIAKKFMGIRKNSKSGLEDIPAETSPKSLSSLNLTNHPRSSGSSPVQLCSLPPLPIPPPLPNSQPPLLVKKISQSQLRRPISRPSIPPPEPPTSVYGGSSNGSANNFNIYTDKSEALQSHAEDDDFDDSDFYDSDSELIRNFVSQVQPIYSMEEEPLYQYYAYGISIKPDDEYQPVIPKNLGLTLDMLVPRVGQRTLWCELSEVIASGILSILSDKQKQLQEAIFEILTSEVSYLKSLDVLINVFFKNKELNGVLNFEEKNCLFGNIEQVKECAHDFLSELLAKWNESWYIQEIGETINRNTMTRFLVYKEYCRNKPHQDKVMQTLRHTRDEFVNVIKTLEEDPRCQMLRMDSFLMLPMQRITRLPLLVNAVIQRTTSAKEKTHCEEALKSLTNLVLECNDAARESQDAEETSSILEKLEFPRGIPPKPLSSLGQFVMKGDFMKNPFDQGKGGNQINWTFRKSKRTMYWILLFANQLFITKKRTNGKFEVLDQSAPEDSNFKPLPNLEGVTNDFQHFFMLHFDKKETVYFLAARTSLEVERWKKKLESYKSTKKLRVESIFPYEARRPDELSFGVGDVIEVTQMQPDGWYYGTKANGGDSGYFPGNYCAEI